MDTISDLTTDGPGPEPAAHLRSVAVASGPLSPLSDRESPVTKYLFNYTPDERLVSASHWAVIGPFVIETAAEAAPLTSYEAKYIVSPLAQYVDWQWTRGEALDRATIFNRRHIDQYIRERTKQLSKGTRGNYRSVLRRVSEVFEGPQDVSERPIPLTASAPAKPYSAADELAHRTMVRGQATELRRQCSEVLLALGYGAGLPTEEIALVHGHHIVVVPEGVEVHVPGRRARVVPVLREWESALVAAALRVGEGKLFRPNREGYARNLVNSFVDGLGDGGAPRLSTQRMRATWIVRMLNASVKVNVIMAMAGVSDLYAIARYVQFMDPVPTAEAHAAVRALGRPGRAGAA